MEDVSFYLIHNNSKDRIDLRNKLRHLSDSLNIKLVEICKQNKNLKINYSFKNKLVVLRILLLRIYYDLKHKYEFSFKFFFLSLKSIIKLNKSIFEFILQDRDKNLETFKHLKIESIIARKHIKAWEDFLKSNKKIMIIFEDDTICKKDSERKLKGFLGRLQNIDFKNIYIDLAGGLNPYDVIPKRKIEATKDEFLLVKGIYTNTACSYLINKNLAKLLYAEYLRSKLNEYLPIDHLINKLAMKINKSQNIFSIHLHEPLFTHGSFKGNIKSWQIY